MIVKDNAKDFEKFPTGLQPAICCGVHDLGVQPGFQGALTHKCVLIFEMAERRTEGDFAGKRFIVTQTYSASLNEKSNLSKDLESWRGRKFTAAEREGFDLDTVVSVNATLNMIEKTKKSGGISTIIGTILPPLKEAEKLTAENPPDFMPKWIRVLLGQEHEGEYGDEVGGEFDDDIPF